MQRGVQFEADPHLGGAGPGRVDQVQLGRVVQDHGDGGGQLRVGGELGEAGAVAGGVGEQDVAQAGAGQPERLGEGEAHHPGEALHGQYPLQQGAAAHRLAGHPDRLAPGPAHQVGRVGVEGRQVDDGHRAVQVGGGPVVPGAVGGRGGGRRRGGRSGGRGAGSGFGRGHGRSVPHPPYPSVGVGRGTFGRVPRTGTPDGTFGPRGAAARWHRVGRVDRNDFPNPAFVGKSIPDPGFSGDDGTADQVLTAALARWTQDPAAEPQVLAALTPTRLMVPIVAILGEVEVDEHGHKHDKSSDMAVPLVEAADGRRALPAFTSLESLAR